MRVIHFFYSAVKAISKLDYESWTRITFSLCMRSKSGEVVRALASHQCGPGLNPGVQAIYGLSLLLALSLAPRGFSSGTPVFPCPQKPTLNSNSIWNARTRLNEFIKTLKCFAVFVSVLGHFRVPPGFCIKTRLSAQSCYGNDFFHSHANKTHFHKKGCALDLILKVRVFGTRKRPITNYKFVSFYI